MEIGRNSQDRNLWSHVPDYRNSICIDDLSWRYKDLHMSHGLDEPKGNAYVNLIVLKKKMLDILQAKSNNKWKWYYNSI